MNKENITLDITSKTYDNNTKTLPEHLFDVYLSEVGQYFGLKEKYNISDPYDDKLKMIVLFYSFEPDHLYYDCSELYSDLKPEDEELE